MSERGGTRVGGPVYEQRKAAERRDRAIGNLQAVDLEALLHDVGRLDVTHLNRPALELVIMAAQDLVRAYQPRMDGRK